ncbi:MAG: orotidine-5'-phosphate decarboxylase [Sphingomonas sp.]|nr:orotidine-5'-phosphate decarboxylase [Sphingomonas sp.]RZV51404.1 MAG: orotidine-5'-phosphate decarboxylase [Sphingomonadaceae bacterium]
MSNPIYVAIDTPNLRRAKEIASAVSRHAGGLKLGLEFFVANGMAGVEEIAAGGLPVFLDLKLHDIPSTVGKAVQAMRPFTPSIMTVHAGGGRAMMEDAKAAAPESTKVVGVSVLTSLDSDDLKAIGLKGNPQDQVNRLAGLAREAGLDGIVCSGNEVGAVKKDWKDGYFVVPGIRPQGSDVGDQKRIMTPRQALDAGASVLVIGRAVTNAENPDDALRAIGATL